MNNNYDTGNQPIIENVTLKNVTLDNALILSGTVNAFINDDNTIPLDLKNGVMIDGEYFDSFELREMLLQLRKLREVYPELYV